MTETNDFILYGAIGLGAYILYKKFLTGPVLNTGEKVAAQLRYYGEDATTGQYGDYAMVNIGKTSNLIDGGDTYTKITPDDYASLNWAQKVLLGLHLVSIKRYIQ